MGKKSAAVKIETPGSTTEDETSTEGQASETAAAPESDAAPAPKTTGKKPKPAPAEPEPEDDVPPTEEEIAAAVKLLRASKKPAAPTHAKPADLPHPDDVDVSKIKTAVLTQHGWLVPDSVQKQANG